MNKSLLIPMALLAGLLVHAACVGASEPEASAPPSPATATSAVYQPTSVVTGGTLAGRITFSGPAPEVETLQVTRNNTHCGQTKQSEALLVAAGGGVQNVAVQLVDIRSGKPFAASAQNPSLDQKACVYVPHVQIMPVGAKLELINSDPILHNVHGYIDGSKTIFNLAMPLQNQKIVKTVDQEGIIRLQCDAGHTWMSAYVVVAGNPYYDLTDPDGAFSIGEIPAGAYQVRIWHEKLGQRMRQVNIEAGGTVHLDVDFASSND